MLYSLLWKAARPLLRRHKRLRQGFEQRLIPSDWPYAPDLQTARQVRNEENSRNIDGAANETQGYFDLWIQAASGGESYLAWELMRVLGRENPGLRVLCTACTSQGLEILRQAQGAPELASLDLTLNYLPLDEPELMKRAVAQVFGPEGGGSFEGSRRSAGVRPRGRLLVLLETEIWPGLLAACRAAGVRVLIVNARMTESSYRAYRLLAPWLRPLAPDAILATGKEDLKRFCKIFDNAALPPVKTGKIPQRELMLNMKFDRLHPLQAETEPVQAEVSRTEAGQSVPLLLFASVREEEEPGLVQAALEILRELPQIALAVAPRHMHRVRAWKEQLAAAGLEHSLRSALPDLAELPVLAERATRADHTTLAELADRKNVFSPGRVYLWDVFGELGQLYRLADAVFVGGSLAPLGGQNFLEPLSCGLVPCIGPSWSNFHWVGSELFDIGLVRQVTGTTALVPALLDLLRAPRPKAAVLSAFKDYLEPRQGGTLQATRLIQAYL